MNEDTLIRPLPKEFAMITWETVNLSQFRLTNDIFLERFRQMLSTLQMNGVSTRWDGSCLYVSTTPVLLLYVCDDTVSYKINPKVPTQWKMDDLVKELFKPKFVQRNPTNWPYKMAISGKDYISEIADESYQYDSFGALSGIHQIVSDVLDLLEDNQVEPVKNVRIKDLYQNPNHEIFIYAGIFTVRIRNIAGTAWITFSFDGQSKTYIQNQKVVTRAVEDIMRGLVAIRDRWNYGD